MSSRSLLLLLLPWAALLGAPTVNPDPVPGWHLELLAHAPDIQNPSVVTCAPDGRIFVAEDPMDIRTALANAMEGRIICLHPDGQRSVFAEGLGAAFGLQYLEGRLYVLHNPYLSAFIDGGDRAGARTDVVRNTNPAWHALNWNDHVPANFRLGMDGRFYLATGDKGLFGAIGPDGKPFNFFGGGIVRLWPDGRGLEPFSTGVRNILDVALDAEDEIFTYDNTDEHEWMGRLTHMVEAGFYGYPHDFIPRRPYTLWMMADFGAGAATGALAYTEDALPSEFHGNLFLSDFGKRQVLRIETERDGGTFRVRARTDLFPDPPEDFRPVGITLHPDGRSLLICDWQHRDTKEEKASCGRLWKLTWNGPSQATARPEWYVPAALGRPVSPTPAALLVALGHPSRSVRLTAQRLLAAQGPRAVPEIRRLLHNRTAGDPARVHALWALASIDLAGLAATDLAQLIEDPAPVVARQALRAAGESGFQPLTHPVSRRLTDSDASLRQRAATALGRLHDARAVPALTAALADPDLFTRHAAFQALNRIGRANPTAWPTIAMGLESPSDPIREGTEFALRETHEPALVMALDRIAGDAQAEASVRATAVRLLGPAARQRPAWHGEWWAYHPFRTTPPARTVDWSGTGIAVQRLRLALADGDPAVRLAAVDGLLVAGETNQAPLLHASFSTESSTSVRAALVHALGELHDAASGPLVARLVTNAATESAVRDMSIAASEQVGGPGVEAALLQRLESTPSPEETVRCIRALAGLRSAGAVTVLANQARKGSTEVRRAAIAALGHVGGDSAQTELGTLLELPDPEDARAVLGALTGSPGTNAVPRLLEAWHRPTLRTDALNALARVPDARALDAYLEGLGSRNPEVRTACRRAIGVVRSAVRANVEARVTTFPPEVLSQLQEVFTDEPGARGGPLFRTVIQVATPEDYLEAALKPGGDPGRGRKLFFDTAGLNCIACHRVGREGGEVGPDLGNAGAQFSPRELAESILWPSRVVREGYQVLLIELKDGTELSGLPKGETPDHLLLRDAAGQLRTVEKSEVLSRRLGDQSLMPDGLASGLSQSEFADLVAFVGSLKGK